MKKYLSSQSWFHLNLLPSGAAGASTATLLPDLWRCATHVICSFTPMCTCTGDSCRVRITGKTFLTQDLVTQVGWHSNGSCSNNAARPTHGSYNFVQTVVSVSP
jgi:hypothetical protein